MVAEDIATLESRARGNDHGPTTQASSYAGTDLLVLLERAAHLSAEALARARVVHSETQERIESVITRLGLMSEQKLATFLSESTGMPLLSAVDIPQSPVISEQISARFLRDQRALPLWRQGSDLAVAFANPLDGFAAEAIGFATTCVIVPHVGLASDIEAALDRLHGAEAAADTQDGGLDEEDLERLKDLASDAPAIRAVNRLIIRAGELHASDIHLEPAEDRLAVRFRIDGVMREMPSLGQAMKQALVSRIKVMAGLNIAERRMPQDGRLRLVVRGQDIDMRVATSPTIHGESVVIRLLDRSHLALEFDALGFTAAQAARFLANVRKPHGIVLVTGPTGSGKTTTLYTALNAVNSVDRKILTVEDPIEYRLAGISQTQVQPAIGLSFAAALRSFLRQDPDMVMVGEIRDLETAQVAVQAALTGHGILSTLHTNSAASAVTRLIDMGVEPFLITSTVNAVLAQRLVRRLCAECSEPNPAAAELLRAAAIVPVEGIDDFRRPVGCTACGGSGFRGRLALVELLEMSDALAALVLRRAEDREIQAAAAAAGMTTMLQDGLAKAGRGQTPVEEVLRVTREI